MCNCHLKVVQIGFHVNCDYSDYKRVIHFQSNQILAVSLNTPNISAELYLLSNFREFYSILSEQIRNALPSLWTSHETDSLYAASRPYPPFVRPPATLMAPRRPLTPCISRMWPIKDLEKGAIGEAATKPRAVLAVECGEGKNAAPRSLLVHFVTKSDREKWCMLQGINDFSSFLKKSNLRSRGQTSLERSFRSAG